jgi:hypothetical protein
VIRVWRMKAWCEYVDNSTSSLGLLPHTQAPRVETVPRPTPVLC